jgi:hypothetical protein
MLMPTTTSGTRRSTKDFDDLKFEGTPINETLVRDLASGDFCPAA